MAVGGERRPFLDHRALMDWLGAGRPGCLSVVMPAHNEEGNVGPTASTLSAALTHAGIDHEIVVVNDGSTDGTAAEVDAQRDTHPRVRRIDNPSPNGFGFAVRRGLDDFQGDAVAICMADGSEDPQDVIRFYRTLQEGYDCVFGSRFISGGRVFDYPAHKLLINRMANLFVRLLFGMRYNDTTNAFKMYRRATIAGLHPFLSPHFNITVELPLKAIVRGYSYAVLPNSWRNRKRGVSKFLLREAGSRYLFIVLYCLLEKLLSRGDYRYERFLEQTRGKDKHAV